MIFRNGGIIKQNEKFFYNGERLENVRYYKYLGLTMSSRLSWSPAQMTLAAQASKALQLINCMNYECNYSFKCACEIFDKCVLPIISYGSEIWGPNIHSSIENVHYKFCKKQLGVGSRTPNPAVLGECGRDRVYVQCYIKSMKYWTKLLALPEESLLRSCYNLLYQQCQLGKRNWASDIKSMLYRYGYGFVWEEQNVENAVVFIKDFSQRVKDCELQLWSTSIHEMSKLRLYVAFKHSRTEEMYLSCDLPKRLRSDIARFRTSSHCLEIEVGRHNKIAVEDRLCKFCVQQNIYAIENEYHVFYHCSAYDYVREMFIVHDRYRIPNEHNFNMYMQMDQREHIIKIANFISTIFKIRRQLL